MSGFARHRTSRRVIANFSGFEADLLRSLAGQLIELLRNERAAPVETADPLEALLDFSGPTSEPEDPVLRRLFPTAYAADGSRRLLGIEAVIDKDLAGERLAAAVNADLLVILTDVPKVAINYNTPDQKWLDTLTLSEMEELEKKGHFKAGSMGPKVNSALRFVRNGGQRAIIASLEEALEAIDGKKGTQIVKN